MIVNETTIFTHLFLWLVFVQKEKTQERQKIE